MSLQGVFNTRMSEKIGSWQSNFIVQGIGFFVTLAILLFVKSGNIHNIKQVNKLYMLGGVLGVIIIFTVMEGIKLSGVTCAISTILIAQLVSAALIDAFGLFGTSQVKFGAFKIGGVILMIAGILLFKWKC